MKEAIIRNWMTGDDEGIFALFDRTARWVSNEAYRGKFNDKGLKPEGIVLAEADGLIIGHLMGNWTKIMCEGKPSLFGGIGQVMVDENYRGRGIGKEMLRRIIQYHVDGGCRGILLWTQDDRIPAYPIYEKLGFRIAVRRATYRFRMDGIKSSLSIEPYSDAFADETEKIRQEWMQASFPVGIGNMKPGRTNWWVVLRERQPAGYVHINDRDGVPFLSQAVAYPAIASEVFGALLAHLKELGHKEGVWQTCVGSIWEAELQKHGILSGHAASDVRMCLSIGSPIDTHNQRPEFDGCSTW